MKDAMIHPAKSALPGRRSVARSPRTSPLDRRSFLAGLGQAGAVLAAGSWLESIGYAQARTRGPARAFLRRSPGRADFGAGPDMGAGEGLDIRHMEQVPREICIPE